MIGRDKPAHATFNVAVWPRGRCAPLEPPAFCAAAKGRGRVGEHRSRSAIAGTLMYGAKGRVRRPRRRLMGWQRQGGRVLNPLRRGRDEAYVDEDGASGGTEVSKPT